MFLFLPYKTDLEYDRRPIVTYVIVALCVVIHFMQANNRYSVSQAAGAYCSEIYDSAYSEDDLDFLRSDIELCSDYLFMVHSKPEFTRKKFMEEYQFADDADLSDEERQEIIRLQDEHYTSFALRSKSSLDAKLVYEPTSWNPFKMLTSELAHGGWGHLIGNLIIFLVFAPSLEILIGNKIKFLGVLGVLTLLIGAVYSISTLSDAMPLPTLGLSGVVFGMIGLGGYLMPQAGVRTFIWFIVFFRFVSIPVWLFAVWYIGWEIYDLMTLDYDGGINIVAHVTGGISGYLIGYFKLRDVREMYRDELSPAPRFGAYKTRASNKALAARRASPYYDQSALQQEMETQQHSEFMQKLYHTVCGDDHSTAICMILERYDPLLDPVAKGEKIYQELVEWPKGRSFLCFARMLISAYMKSRQYAKAMSLAQVCVKFDRHFVLANPMDVLIFVSEAMSQHHYKLAYELIRNAHKKYGDAIDLEKVDLLKQELKRLLSSATEPA